MELVQLRTQKIAGGASTKLTKMYAARAFPAISNTGPCRAQDF